MSELYFILLRKKLNIKSYLFMAISLILIIICAIYEAAFNISSYELTVNEDIYVASYLSSIFEIIPIVMLLIILIILVPEANSKARIFDAYFLAGMKKSRFYITKIWMLISIFSILYAYIICGISIIYLLRFDTNKYLFNLLKIAHDYYIYLLASFFISYFFLLIFSNIFSLLIPIILYYVSRLMIDLKIDKVLRLFILRINIDYSSLKSSFDVEYKYIILYLSYFVILDYLIYKKMDLKI